MLVAAHTDVGIRKKVNQDSLLVREAQLQGGSEVLLAAVCDGMGGLTNGEVASKEAVNCLSYWFDSSLPELLTEGVSNNNLKKSLNLAILDADDKLGEFSYKEGECGTTLAGLFLYNGKYACVNVGDSRVYQIHENEIVQLTHDQTLVQREIDEGTMTPQEAEKSPNRSVLLQCIGAGGDMVPDYTFGEYVKGDVFLLCSDGFRHKIKSEQMMEMFAPAAMTDEEKMKETAFAAVELNKYRKEKDNISVIAIKA